MKRKNSDSNGVGEGKRIKLNESLRIIEERNSSSNSQINLAKNTQIWKLETVKDCRGADELFQKINPYKHLGLLPILGPTQFKPEA